MTMRERMARALLKSQWPTVTWDNCVDKAAWFHSADVALAALGTPDEGMVEAGDDASEEYAGSVPSIYAAMIKHARKERG